MPKQQRQFEIGGIYHVFNRGVEKRKIFLKNQDYSRFILALEFFNRIDSYLDIWDLIVPKGGPGPPLARLEKERIKDFEPLVEFLVFCLMPNHFHFIIREIHEGGISLFMNKLGGYSTYFNKQYDRVGPLFQGRYKSVKIKNDTQLINIFSYAHTNPVELVESEWKDLKVKNKKNALKYLETYKWSSYRDYIGKPTYPAVVNRKFFLDLLSGEKGCKQVVEDWISFKAQNAGLDGAIYLK